MNPASVTIFPGYFVQCTVDGEVEARRLSRITYALISEAEALNNEDLLELIDSTRLRDFARQLDLALLRVGR